MRNPKHLDHRTPVIELLEPAMVEILRQKTEGERLAISWAMWRSVRDMLTNLIRSEHPGWSQDDVRREVAWRMSHGTD